MSMTPQLKDWYVKTTPGMNNKVEDLELNGQWVEKAQNCRFDEQPGAVNKRPPMAYYNSSEISSSAGILGLYRYYSSSTTKSVCASANQVYVGDDTAGTWTSIRTLGTTGNRMSFVTYQNLLIGCNGQDNLWVYDGSSDNVTWELGACKALLGSGAGNLDASAAYYYAITMDDDAYVCGAVSNTVTTDGSNQKIELSNIPLGPVGTTNRKIYRTEGGGSSLYLIATISDNTTTTYSDNIADTTATALPSVTDDMPKGDILLVHRERLFIAGDPNSKNRIYYSNPYLPGYIQQTTNLDYMDIAKDDGDEIMGLAIQLGSLICIKKNTIRKVYITSATSGADPANWYAEDPLVWKGTPAKRSVVQTSYGVVFLSWDGWHVFDGAKVVPIIETFDEKEILPGLYTNVIAYWNKGILYASYSDRTTATQYNNRIMVYDFSLDKWSYDTINANCFSAHIGSDETGDLYIGDSVSGYVYKMEEGALWYSLNEKTECSAGTQLDTYVGGTDAAPYIELGDTTTADEIPDDICIFWEDEDNDPGSGWTEITAAQGYFVQLSTGAVAATGGTAGHTHTISGILNTSSAGSGNSGDGNNQCMGSQHQHTVSGDSDSATAKPKRISFRIFKKNNTTTEYTFPEGSIVMWDQPTAPTGWYALDKVTGYYVDCAATALGVGVASEHNHTFTSLASSTQSQSAVSDTGTDRTKGAHNHTISGTTSTASLEDWELDCAKFRFIKKLGEEDTWDGTSKYVYALYHNTSAPGNGWTDASATYAGLYLKGHSSTPTTGTASGSSHTHEGTFYGNSSSNTQKWGNGGYNATALDVHTHVFQVTASTETLPDPQYYTFHICKKELGKMQDYNTALSSSYTNGLWISPALEINAESLGSIYFNVTKSTADSFTVFTKTASTTAGLAATSCAADSAANTIVLATHGLSNANRVVIGGTAVPTGVKDDFVYYVVGAGTGTFQVSETSGGAAVAFSSTGTAVTFKKWNYAITASGSLLSDSANVWFQYLLAFTATNSTVSNPQLYTSGGYLLKFDYTKKGTSAETSIEFIYDTGWINFNEPMADKIFQKIVNMHEGTTGSLTIYWETENSSGSFVIDLANYPSRWESFFPATAMGRKIRFKWYKNDVNDLKLKEAQGLYQPQPVII